MNSMLEKCDFCQDEYSSTSCYYSDYSDYSDYEDDTMSVFDEMDVADVLNYQVEQEMYDEVSLDSGIVIYSS